MRPWEIVQPTTIYDLVLSLHSYVSISVLVDNVASYAHIWFGVICAFLCMQILLLSMWRGNFLEEIKLPGLWFTILWFDRLFLDSVHVFSCSHIDYRVGWKWAPCEKASTWKLRKGSKLLDKVWSFHRFILIWIVCLYAVLCLGTLRNFT